MPPKAKVDAGLLALNPSAEELDSARAILRGANDKQKRSKMAAMTQWLKKHPETEGHQEALDTRGEARASYLLRYMILDEEARGIADNCDRDSRAHR